MKLSLSIFLMVVASSQCTGANIRHGRRTKGSKKAKKESSATQAPTPKKCPKQQYSETHSGPKAADNSERLLLRENVISELPPDLCTNASDGKNVILVIGDGMGWEMIRAGAVAKEVLDELESLGCDTSTGCSGAVATAARTKFKGRKLSSYYEEGKGHGMSWQNLSGYGLVTTSAPVLQKPADGAHYAPSTSLLEGSVSDHYNGMAALAIDECTGEAIDFNPTDFEDEGGNMALWNDKKGGKFPWDKRYLQGLQGVQKDGFDPEFIMRHATDSANTAGSYATGVKASVNMMSVDLYEEDVSTIIEDAMKCGKAGGVVSSVPMLHATPGAFIVHSNNRNNGTQMRRSLEFVNPTYVSGACAGSSYHPGEDFLDKMRPGGSLSNQWTLIEQSPNVMAENFFDPLEGLHPDNDDHVMVCWGGGYTASGQSNAPYRGLDSSYDSRYCSAGSVITDGEGLPIDVVATTSSETCDHYSAEEVATIPKMADQVKAAIEFLGKDKDGFFLMYEQGDIDWAAHADHMDDMLGAMLDMNDGVQVIMDWIAENGGWEKNALYVSADHDHYLTLMDNFPEAVANFVIDGESHKITPQNNSNVNPWSVAIKAGLHKDSSKSVTEHISGFSTWTEQDIKNVQHFWGAFGSGGNGWGSHTTRPVPISYDGDDGCLELLEGKGYNVVGRHVEGSPGKVDQVHVHACMMKALFNL